MGHPQWRLPSCPQAKAAATFGAAGNMSIHLNCLLMRDVYKCGSEGAQVFAAKMQKLNCTFVARLVSGKWFGNSAAPLARMEYLATLKCSHWAADQPATQGLASQQDADEAHDPYAQVPRLLAERRRTLPHVDGHQ